MNSHLRYLIRRGEDEGLDYKQVISDAAKIAKTMSAFANHKGGVILVGVRDNQTISGVNSEDEIYMLDLAANFYCKPQIPIEIRQYQVKDKLVVECIVPQGEDKPYYAKDEDGKWWAYIRVKDQSLLASKVVLDVLKRSTKEEPGMIRYTDNEQHLLKYLHQNDRITLDKFRKMTNISKRRASRILVNLISAGVIRNHTTEKTEFYTLAEVPGVME